MIASASAGPLVPGTIAPWFSLPDAPHARLDLDDLRGRPVVLVFYVADWHPVATEQLQTLARFMPALETHGAAVLGIAPDGTWSHAAYAAHLGLPFPLLADHAPRGAIAAAYGVWSAGNDRGRRAVFVLDGTGVVRWAEVVDEGVNPGVDGVLSALEEISRS